VKRLPQKSVFEQNVHVLYPNPTPYQKRLKEEKPKKTTIARGSAPGIPSPITLVLFITIGGRTADRDRVFYFLLRNRAFFHKRNID
jgi:hypothetical protein